MSEHFEKMDGRRVVISDTPENLYERILGYFKWCQDNPIKLKRTIMAGNQAGKEVELTRIRPYTIKGLCLHCGILKEYLEDIMETLDQRSEFYVVVAKALYVIHTQVAEMAMIGEFSPVFAARIMNIDKSEDAAQPIRVEVVGGLPQLSSTENEILEKLKSENKLFNDMREQ